MCLSARVKWISVYSFIIYPWYLVLFVLLYFRFVIKKRCLLYGWVFFIVSWITLLFIGWNPAWSFVAPLRKALSFHWGIRVGPTAVPLVKATEGHAPLRASPHREQTLWGDFVLWNSGSVCAAASPAPCENCVDAKKKQRLFFACLWENLYHSRVLSLKSSANE